MKKISLSKIPYYLNIFKSFTRGKYSTRKTDIFYRKVQCTCKNVMMPMTVMAIQIPMTHTVTMAGYDLHKSQINNYSSNERYVFTCGISRKKIIYFALRRNKEIACQNNSKNWKEMQLNHFKNIIDITIKKMVKVL